MAMSKKDYELIAKVIKESSSFDTPFETEARRRDFAHTMAVALAADNPRFNRSLFITAATPSSAYPARRAVHSPAHGAQRKDHDYEPGSVTHPMHTDPDCAICGDRKH